MDGMSTKNPTERRICAECDELYTPRQDSQRYCSPDCRKVGHNAHLNYDKAVALRVYRRLQAVRPTLLAKIVATLP